MFRVVDDNHIVYKLGKENVTRQVISAIPKIMAAEGFISYIPYVSYNREEYSSYFVREIEDEEVMEVIDASQQEYEENIEPAIEQKKDIPEEQPEESEKVGKERTLEKKESEYRDYFDEEYRRRDLNTNIPSGMPTKEELKAAQQEAKMRRRKKPKLFRELAEYGYEFIWFKIVAFYIVTALIAIGLAIIFRLIILPSPDNVHPMTLWNYICTIALVLGFLLMMPMVVKAHFKGKYEEKRHHEVTTYIEQMLYSFRKNSKILASLRDALTVFPEHTKMHDTILEAIQFSQNAEADGNLYENTFKIIENEYPCRRIRSLHRYMMKGFFLIFTC